MDRQLNRDPPLVCNSFQKPIAKRSAANLTESMYRWFIGALLVAIVLFVLIAGRTATKTSYVNGLPLYSQIPGREYIFQRDCYIFKFKDSDSDWPYVASHLTVPALPENVDLKNVGGDYSKLRILDIVTTGSRFRIVSVRRDQKGTRVTITYEILFADEAARKFPRVDALWMLDRSDEDPASAPNILADYAVPRRSS